MKFRFGTETLHNSSLALWLTLALTGCKITSASEVTHEIGTVTQRTKPFFCTKKAPEKKLEAFHKYLYDHVKRIEASSAAIIPQAFRADQFCLLVEESKDINAYAIDDGTVAILTGLLNATETDAQFAAVVAHEMAHVLQGHGSERIPDEMKDNSDYKTFFGLMTQHKDSLIKLQQKMENSAKINKEDEKKIGAILAEYLAIFDAYSITLTRNPYTSWKQDFYQNLVVDPMPPEFIDSSQSFRKRRTWPASTLRGMAQDARKKILANIDTKLASEFLALEKDYLKDTSGLFSLASKFSEADRRAKVIMAARTGLPRASNWREQEADEVGFELFLRAGYDYREYLKMLENLEKGVKAQTNSPTNSTPPRFKSIQPGAKIESLADEIEGTSCQRGTSSHPKVCWRMADIKNEWEVHQAFYALIAPKQPAINVFGDRLKDLRDNFLPKKASSAPGKSSAPEQGKPTSPAAGGELPEWCDPFKPKQCFSYCKSLTADLELSGWGREQGKTCVIRGGPVDQRN
jgi:Zn-dependent protease with chaperone function